MKPLIDKTTTPPGYIQNIKHNKNKIYLGSNIKKLRKAYGFTQQQLSNKINKQRGMVSLYEKESVYPDLMTLIDLSNLLKVNLISLIFDNIGIETVIKIRQDEQDNINQLTEQLTISDVRRAAFNETYDKFVECEDDNAYTKWLNKVCG